MLPVLLYKLLLFITALAAMEGVAYLSHKYLMHGPLWCWHASHHLPRQGIFEKNDLFALGFSLPAMVLIYFGVNGFPAMLWLGLGMTGYGIVYFIFHDVIVHRRLPYAFKAKSTYMKRIIQAHWIHHSSREKHGAVSFGFIYAPPIAKLKSLQKQLSGNKPSTPSAETS
jgi:beta-carotene 3-hydroxylase